MKKGFILGIIVTLILTSIVLASDALQDVFTSSFPVTVNGQEYTSELPILNYQGRTYLPLREFGNATGVNVDFQDNTIIVDNYAKNRLFLFATNAFYLNEALHQIDSSIDLINEYYLMYFSNNPFDTSSLNVVNSSINNINQWHEVIDSQNLNMWLVALTKDTELESLATASLSLDIENYLSKCDEYNSSIITNIKNNKIDEDVVEKWDELRNQFIRINNQLIDFVTTCQKIYTN